MHLYLYRWAPVIVDTKNIFISQINKIFSEIMTTHCMAHREALACKEPLLILGK